jgi:integrase
MVLLGRLAGLRRMEIAGLHTRDILQCQHGETTGLDLYIVGKGGRERIVHLHSAIHVHLAAVLPRGGFVFPGQIDGHLSPAHVGKLMAAVLPAGTTPHQLRHAAATAWYAVDRDLLAVQQLLGHSSPTTTQRYTAAAGNSHLRAITCASL